MSAGHFQNWYWVVNNTTTHVVRIHGTEQYLHYKGWLNETGVQRDHGQSPAVRVTCQFYSGVETPYHHFRGQLLAFPIRFKIKVARLMSEEGEECVCVVVPCRATGRVCRHSHGTRETNLHVYVTNLLRLDQSRERLKHHRHMQEKNVRTSKHRSASS